MTTPESKPQPVCSVPLLDLKAQYETLRPGIEAVIRDVCESQQFIMGPHVLKLEESIAEYSGTKFGIGVSSGTDALLVALMALDVGIGDEVITTTYSFFATGGVIARLGARPVFCDIDKDTYNIDPAAVRRYLESECRTEAGRTVNAKSGAAVKAIMPVHLYGQVADMQSLQDIARNYRLAVVEDAAQAIGSEAPGSRRAGSIGDVGCFSFFPSKNLGAFGDAGMCVTGSEELAERLRILRLHGASPKYHHAVVGGNFRLDAIQAAVLNVKLDHLDGWTSARQQNAERYTTLLNEAGVPLKTPFVDDRGRHIFNQYVVETERRDPLQAFLRERNIGTEIYYPIPLHRQQCFAYLGYEPEDFPVAEGAAARTLALPVYPELSQQQQDYVIDSIVQFFGNRSG
jgi:dTDP-4-amino-4,6-dideoxygalactose transaminase